MVHVGKALSGLTKIGSLLGTICIVLMMLHVTADVVGRYVFNAPLTGTIVIVGHYYMIIVVFIALGVAEEKNAHISVEFLTDMMPRTIQGWLSVFSGLFTIFVFGLLAISGFTEAMKKTNSGASMEQGSSLIAIWPSYWAIPIGGALICLIAGYKVLVRVFKTRNGLHETLEADEIVHD
ncbi:TRAP transporter small permease [Neptunicoccus sediminis]|uniref:TRAP transporter small permease n=1 Tax=Neptunicoccus sediminis TaxID=1892596 RepID=UPI000845BD3D|nr:TRAP transporter small permease [Neptunicoccus sediminis]